MTHAVGSARARWRAILLLAGGLLPGTALAQLITDEVPRSRTVPTLEQIKSEVENSRFRLGPIRVIPSIRLSNAGYDSNVFGASDGQEKVADWSATVSAGIRAILPVGSKVYLRGDVLPQYVWYKDLGERRTFGGRYLGSFLGFFNRAALEVTGYGTRGLEFITSESETQAVQTVSNALAKLELDLTGKLSLFARAELLQVLTSSTGAEPAPGELDVDNLDRFDRAGRGGVRYRISDVWDVSAAYEATQTEFESIPQDRDNQGQAYLVGVHYGRPRFFINVSGGYREGRPFNGSAYPKYSTTTGSYFLSYFLTRKVELEGHGSRRVVYALSRSDPYFFQTRNGAGLSIEVRPRIRLRGFGGFGTNDYPFGAVVANRKIKRRDKANSYGGGFSLLFYRNFWLTALVSRSNYTSEIPGRDRSVLRFTTNLFLQGAP